jgi:hypothetical protein
MPTLSPTQTPTDAPTSEPTNIPTSHPTESPTQAPTNAPTLEPTEIPTEAPTVTPRCITDDAIIPFPNNTYCLAPNITQVCQLPTNSSLTCLTFDDLSVPSSSPLAIVLYRGYSFLTENGGGGRSDINVFNNSFSPINLSSSWPNYLSTKPGFIEFDMSNSTFFDLLSLTIALPSSKTIEIFGFSGNVQVYSYFIRGFTTNTPTFLILNWTNLTEVHMFTAGLIIVDSIVATRKD